MAVDPSVRIDIAAEFTGRKAFKQADTSTAQLSKNVKNLAKTFGVAFSTAKVLAYAKASIKAAAEDAKAQKQLALALKNVGLGRDAATAEGYIQRIEKEFGIIDDKLRPAYTKLAIATRDTAETERLMGIAMDISANSGKDLEAVTAALSKAYLGNNATLSKLGIGISKADLKTKSFKEITDQLAVTFAGAAKTSADSFAGSIDKLAIAGNNAKEIIGTSLIGALQSLGEDDSMATLAGSIEGAAKSLANFVDSVVYLKEQIKSIPGAGIFGYLFSGVTDLLGRFSPQRLAELIKGIKGFQGMGNVAMTGGSNMDTQKYDAAQKKILTKKIAADKLAANNKIKTDKAAADNAAKLAKAQSIFDLDKIQIEAALKGKISDNERLRLELQRAILNENFELAGTLQKQLEASQRAIGALQGQLAAIKPPTNPFAETLETLENIAGLLAKISGMPVSIDPGRKGGGILALEPDDLMPLITAPKVTPTPTPTMTEPIPVVVVPSPTPMPSTNNPMPGLGGSSPTPSNFGFSVPGYTYQPPSVTVNVTVEGNVLDGDDFTEKVNDALLNANRTGLPRTAAGFLVDSG